LVPPLPEHVVLVIDFHFGNVLSVINGEFVVGNQVINESLNVIAVVSPDWKYLLGNRLVAAILEDHQARVSQEVVEVRQHCALSIK
jgi:hypothetical protein